METISVVEFIGNVNHLAFLVDTIYVMSKTVPATGGSEQMMMLYQFSLMKLTFLNKDMQY